jgi:hypothetical protein
MVITSGISVIIMIYFLRYLSHASTIYQNGQIFFLILYMEKYANYANYAILKSNSIIVVVFETQNARSLIKDFQIL